jgi:hypothetical protein
MAMVGAEEAIDAAAPWQLPWRCGVLDSFQAGFSISLESLENTVFPFASGGGLKYRWARTLMGWPSL